MPAFAKSSVGSCGSTSGELGTPRWSRVEKKSRKVRRVSREVIVRLVVQGGSSVVIVTTGRAQGIERAADRLVLEARPREGAVEPRVGPAVEPLCATARDARHAACELFARRELALGLRGGERGRGQIPRHAAARELLEQAPRPEAQALGARRDEVAGQAQVVEVAGAPQAGAEGVDLGHRDPARAELLRQLGLGQRALREPLEGPLLGLRRALGGIGAHGERTLAGGGDLAGAWASRPRTRRASWDRPRAFPPAPCPRSSGCPRRAA